MAYSVKNFEIDTDLSRMMSHDLRYIELERELKDAFPRLGDSITVVIDAGTPEAAQLAVKRVVERLKETHLFTRVSLPRGGEFFDQNGLLYLSRDELQDLSDKLAEVQPFLGLISEDYSLRGLFSVRWCLGLGGGLGGARKTDPPL